MTNRGSAATLPHLDDPVVIIVRLFSYLWLDSWRTPHSVAAALVAVQRRWLGVSSWVRVGDSLVSRSWRVVRGGG